MTSASRTSKQALRDRLATHRAELTVSDLAGAARGLCDVMLAAPAIQQARVVASYVSVGREPGTGPLIEALTDSNIEVLLPLLLPDGDLDWARYTGPHALESAPRGLLEPTSTPLGTSAVLDADVVLVPAMAVDRHGVRLGRGGGSYDRVLARLAGRDAFTCALLHEGELLDMPVPREPHDVPVAAAATPTGLRKFS